MVDQSGGLNQYQHSAVEIVLRRMEGLVQRSCALRDAALAPANKGVLVHQAAELSAGQRTHLEALEAATLTEIARLKDEFGFAPQLEDAVYALYAALAILWADLEDTMPPKLRRYGLVDEQAAARLAPHIAKLIELSQAFMRVLRKEPSSEDGG